MGNLKLQSNFGIHQMSDSKTGQILGKDIAGVNCILPHKHKTAWDLFLKRLR